MYYSPVHVWHMHASTWQGYSSEFLRFAQQVQSIVLINIYLDGERQCR